MTISCSCWDDYDGDEYVSVDSDFSILNTARSRKCCSCKTRIKPGEDVVTVSRHRYPRGDIEERIYGEGPDVPMADWYLCETCGGLYWAVADLGMCCDISESIAAQIREFRETEREWIESRRMAAA